MNHDIEAYLDGALAPDALAAFEAELARNPALREAVAAARRVRDDLDWLSVERGVEAGEQAFWDRQSARHNRMRVLAFGLVLILLAGLVWLRQKPAPALPPNRQLHPGQPHTPDSLATPPPPNTSSPLPALKQARDNSRGNRLFATYFKPYKDATLEPSLRGGAAASPEEKFQQHYWDNQYSDALAQFDMLPAMAQTNDNLLFIKAECLLAVGKADEAAPILELILKNDRTRYMDAAAWHLALARLKLGDTAQARLQFQQIRQSAASPWQTDAATILKRIE